MKVRGSLTTLNVTIADNIVAVGGSGGGLDVATGTTTLYNTVVALNSIGIGTTNYSDIAGTVAAVSANNLVGTAPANGITDGTNGNLVGVADPGLAALADNGGPTETIALESSSPALDAGGASFASGTIIAPAIDHAVQNVAPLVSMPEPPSTLPRTEATSSYAVTTVSDSSNVGTLRAAVGWANLSTNANPANAGNAANTVVFDPTDFASPKTITLSIGTISLTNTSTAEVMSDAPVNNVTISGGNNSGVFAVAGGVTAAISDVRIIDGSTLANGGAIDNSGNLTLTEMTLTEQLPTRCDRQ